MGMRVLAVLCFVAAAPQDPPRSIPTLIEKLGSLKIEERDEASKDLLALGELPLEELRSASTAPDAERAIRARRLVALILENRDRIEKYRKGSPKARQTLISEVREIATRDSGGHPPERASSRPDLLPIAELALQDSDEEVRADAVCMLAYMNHPACLPALKACLKHGDSSVRYYACMGLGWLGRTPHHRQEVVLALESARDGKDEKSFNVRLSAAGGLLDLQCPQDAEIFIEALRRDNANHALAAHALASLKRKDAFELILTRLANAKPSLDHWCGQALESLTGQSFGTDHAKWKEWLEANRLLLPAQLR